MREHLATDEPLPIGCDIAVDQWIAACKGGPSPLALNFESEAPVTEAFLLGCIAQRRPGNFLEWDNAQMRITSSEKANAR